MHEDSSRSTDVRLIKYVKLGFEQKLFNKSTKKTFYIDYFSLKFFNELFCKEEVEIKNL